MGKTRDISDFLGDVNTDITSGQFISDITTGTSPLVVSSTTVVSNLNSDTLDGISSGSFVRSDQDDNVTGNITFNLSYFHGFTARNRNNSIGCHSKS